MPKCPTCMRNVLVEEIVVMGDAVTCKSCAESDAGGVKAMTLKSKGLTKVASIVVYETNLENGHKDHLVEAAIKVGGLTLDFSVTLDEIRDFFTKHRKRDVARGS